MSFVTPFVRVDGCFVGETVVGRWKRFSVEADGQAWGARRKQDGRTRRGQSFSRIPGKTLTGSTRPHMALRNAPLFRGPPTETDFLRR